MPLDELHVYKNDFEMASFTSSYNFVAIAMVLNTVINTVALEYPHKCFKSRP